MLTGGGVGEIVIEFAFAVLVASAVDLAVITTAAAGTYTELSIQNASDET